MSVLRSVGSQRLALLVALPRPLFLLRQLQVVSPPVVGLMAPRRAPRGRPMKTRPALATRNIAIIETVIDTAAMLTCDVRIHAKTRESKGRFSAGGGGGLSVKQQSHRELTVISRESSAALNLWRLRSLRFHDEGCVGGGPRLHDEGCFCITIDGGRSAPKRPRPDGCLHA